MQYNKMLSLKKLAIRTKSLHGKDFLELLQMFALMYSEDHFCITILLNCTN